MKSQIYLGFRVYLALVYARVAKLNGLDPQSPFVGILRMYRRKSRIARVRGHRRGQNMQIPLSHPRDLERKMKV